MSKKVLHLITELDLGGTEKQLAMILPPLQASFDNEVLCLSGRGPVGKILADKGVPVHYAGAAAWYDPRVIINTGRIISKMRPDILVTYLFHADMIGRFIGRLLGVRQIICSQRTNLMRYGSSWSLLEKHSQRLVDAYVVQTNVMKGILMSGLKIHPLLLNIIPNAVILPPLKDRSILKAKLSFDDSALLITCVANLKPGKGHQILLKAFAQLHGRYPSIHLLLVGSGPDKPAIKRQLGQMASGSAVHLLGYRPDIADILGASDIFVLPTEREGMSNAILEAMAAGLPCVITDIPVNRELISNNKTGLLSDYDDAHDLQSQLERLIKDEDLRRQLGQAARQYVRDHHSLPYVVRGWRNLLNKEK